MAPVRVLGSQETAGRPKVSLMISEKGPEYGHEVLSAFNFNLYLGL